MTTTKRAVLAIVTLLAGFSVTSATFAADAMHKDAMHKNKMHKDAMHKDAMHK